MGKILDLFLYTGFVVIFILTSGFSSGPDPRSPIKIILVMQIASSRLGLANVRTSLTNMNPQDVRRTYVLDSNNHRQEGLYKVLFKSSKPLTEEFQDHVCDMLTKERLNMGDAFTYQNYSCDR